MLSRQKIIFAILLAIPIFLLSGVVGSVAHAVTETTPTAQAAPATPQKEAPSNLTELETLSSGNIEGDLKMIECAGLKGSVNLTCWIPILTYYAIYTPAMLLLTTSGYIFDYTLSLSIDRVFIEQDFVNNAWTVVRDFSNMVFIFILLYTGIRTMLGEGNWGKTIINIVIIALIINFSMFFSKVIIDAGNILAVGVYEGMGVVKDDIDRPHKPKEKGGKDLIQERNISATLVTAFSPQQFTALAATADKTFVTTVFVIAGIVSFYVAIIFIKAAFMFVGRIIAFWFFMIISPFALISIVIPKVSIFDFWLQGLIKQAFAAPVFLFLVYIIMMAVGTGDGILDGYKSSSNSDFFLEKIIIPVVVTGMITYALQKSLSIAKSMSGSFGDIGARVATGVLTSLPVGLGAKVAFGGAALALRKTVGVKASKFLGSETLRNLNTSDSRLTRMFGRNLKGIAERTEKGSFDVRDAKAFGWMKEKAKSELGVGVDFGKAEGKGGYKKEHEEWLKQAQKDAEKLNMSKRQEGDIEKEHNIPGLKEAVEAAKEAAQAAGTVKDATENLKKAQGVLGQTATGLRVEGATDNVKEARSKAAGFAGDILVKKINDLEAKKANTNDLAQRVAIGNEIDQLNKEAESAKKTLQYAEEELSSAKATHSQTAEFQAFEAAEKALKASEETEKKKKDTEDALVKAVKEAKDTIDKENMRVREQHGKDVAWTSIFTYSEDVKNIREGISKDKKEQEKMMKSFKKLMEEGGEAKKEEKKDEGGEKK